MEPKVKEIQRFKVTKDPNDLLDNFKNVIYRFLFHSGNFSYKNNY